MPRMKLQDRVVCTVLGLGIGAFAGLGVCTWILEGTLLFPGDTIAVGAVTCGVLGFAYGEPFLDWMLDHWSKITRWL